MILDYFHELNKLDETWELEEVFDTHDQLNPQLFQDNYLKPEIRKQLLKVVDEFISYLKEDNIPLDVIDYWLLGSNAAYNYGPKSDIDIHIIVNMEDLGVDPYILQVLYNYIKSDFNKKYDIEVKGHEVELYIEDVRSGAVTNGIYSLKKDKWIKEPIRTEYMYFDVTETDEYKDWYQRYSSLEDSEIEQFINDLYLMRKESLATDGEWGTGNLIFKEFRNLGYLDSLKDRKYKYRSKELTLENLYESKSVLQAVKKYLGDRRDRNSNVSGSGINKNNSGEYQAIHHPDKEHGDTDPTSIQMSHKNHSSKTQKDFEPFYKELININDHKWHFEHDDLTKIIDILCDRDSMNRYRRQLNNKQKQLDQLEVNFEEVRQVLDNLRAKYRKTS